MSKRVKCAHQSVNFFITLVKVLIIVKIYSYKFSDKLHVMLFAVNTCLYSGSRSKSIIKYLFLDVHMYIQYPSKKVSLTQEKKHCNCVILPYLTH